MPPGLVSETFAPWRSSAVSLFSRALAIRSLKASRNCGNVSRPASRITGTISVRPPSFFSTSTAMPRLTRAVVDDVRLAVDLGEVARHDRHLLGRGAGDRVGDQVGEGDPLAGLLELLAAAVERGDGDRAERGRGRDRARLVHVAGEHRARALEQRGAGGLRGRGRRRPFGGGAAVRGGEHVGLADPPGGAGAVHARRGRRRGRRRRGAATGVTFRPSGVAAVAASPAGRGALVGSGAGVARPSAAPAPAAIRAMTWPTVTVSPASARISAIVPDAGAGTSASTLSVEISTIVSSASTASPGCLGPLEHVPSETDSPIAGITMSTVSPRPRAAAGRRPRRAVAVRVAAAGARRRRRAVRRRDLGEHRADADGVALGGVDLHDGAGDRRGDLGVDLVGGDLDEGLVFRDLRRPPALCHSRMVPSETESPIAGMTTSTVVVLTAMNRVRPYRVAACSCAAALRTTKPDAARERPDAADRRPPSRPARAGSRGAARRRCRAAT